MQNLSINHFVFAPVVPASACHRCFDSGIWLTPRKQIETCPRIVLGEAHAKPNNASILLRRAAERLNAKNFDFHNHVFYLARILTNYKSSEPCLRTALFELFFDDTNMTDAYKLRRFHKMVEELRNIWLLPIGSRKSEPSGYWIITDLEDFKDWFERVKAAPIQQLSTIHKVAKHNFPVFAEQIELDFWRDMKDEVEA